MVLTITQETFDNAVLENIADLEMEPEEALSAAVTQFEKQGVDLSNIVKELKISGESAGDVKKAILKLQELVKSKKNSKDVVAQLDIIKNGCDEGVQIRVEAGKAGAYDAVLKALQVFDGDANIQKASLKAMISLMSKQPDLLTDTGVQLIISHLQKKVLDDVKKLTLKWTKECCVMHEMNRQHLMDANIVELLKELMNNPACLKDTLALCRSLVLDDDIRVDFGKAHEHARIIASETLCTVIPHLIRYRYDESLISDIIATISSLLVRTEFCKKVDDAEGIETLGETLKHFESSEKINRQCFKLMKALAGNDDCKAHIVQKQLAPVLLGALERHKDNVPTAIAGLACLSALTLRSPDNSKAVFDSGAPAVIVEIMRLHPNDKEVQKNASWAIRNMVSRSRYQNETFIELGVEQILQNDLKNFKDIEYDIKAALRDLGCKVNLKEEWTGKGGALTHRGVVKKH